MDAADTMPETKKDVEKAISRTLRDANPKLPPAPKNQFDVGVIQVVLAEKRTSLAVLRTGIAVAVVPLSITTVLVTLSRFYDWLENLHFLVPMYTVLTVMMILSFYLMGRSIFRIRDYDRMLRMVRRDNPALAKYLK